RGLPGACGPDGHRPAAWHGVVRHGHLPGPAGGQPVRQRGGGPPGAQDRLRRGGRLAQRVVDRCRVLRPGRPAGQERLRRLPAPGSRRAKSPHLMDIRARKVEGYFEILPRQFPDDRGVFLESFRGDRLAEVIGHRLDIIQTNISVSSRGTVRGVHFADVPPSQAKYATALSGSFIDFVIDIRVGSATFGQWDSVLLDTVDRRAVYLSEVIGHAICSLQDDSTVTYLCSANYNTRRDHAINPLDTELDPVLPAGLTPVLSDKDAVAPST